VLIRRALSFVFALCCALLLWPAFAANPTCGVLLLLLAAVAFADPTAGVMVVLALSPVATMAVSTFWGTPGDWAEMVAVAAALGWLLRQTVRDDCCRPAATAWPAALLACVAIVSLGVQLAVVATRISPALLAVDLAGSLNTYVTARSDSTLVVRPVALLLEGLLVFVVAASPRKADANRRMLRMFVVGACGAAVLNLTRLASGALRSETPFAAALQLARSVRISLPYADVNAAGSYFLLALFTAWGLAAVERRARGGWAIALLVLGAALWISGSRAALVACLVTAIVVSALRAIKLRKYWTLGAVTTGAVVLFATFPYPLIDPRSLDAIAIRAEMSRAAFRMFSTEPLMGIGVGQFFERSGEFIRDPAVHALYARENAHNNFLQILAETGLVGFTAFLWLLVNAGRAIARALRNGASEGALPTGVVAGLCAFLATCLAGHPLLLTEVSLAFWGVLGASVAAAPPVDAKSMLPSRSLAAAALIVLAIGLPFRLGRATNAVDLDHVGFGVTRWNFDREGVRYRQMSSRATLFVPSDATAIELPYRLQWGRDPVTLQLDFRGRTADRVVVSDHEWRTYRLLVPEDANKRRYLPLGLTVLQGEPSAVLLGKISIHQQKGVH
jgi:O-antigen ligase